MQPQTTNFGTNWGTNFGGGEALFGGCGVTLASRRGGGTARKPRPPTNTCGIWKPLRKPTLQPPSLSTEREEDVGKNGCGEVQAPRLHCAHGALSPDARQCFNYSQIFFPSTFLVACYLITPRPGNAQEYPRGCQGFCHTGIVILPFSKVPGRPMVPFPPPTLLGN